MSAYVALLRGVNVGGKGGRIRWSMRSGALFEEQGFEDVTDAHSERQRRLSSGRPKFRFEHALESATSTPSDSRSRRRSCFDQCGRVRIEPSTTPRSLTSDRAHLHVGFSDEGSHRAKSSPPSTSGASNPSGSLRLSGSEAYLSLPLGMGRSKLASYVDRRWRTPMTVRNWKTVNSLAEPACYVAA